MMSTGQPGAADDASVQAPPDSFGGQIHWDAQGGVVTVAADRSVESIVRRIHDEKSRWVVVVRAPRASAEVYYYAFRYYELEQLAEERPERKKWTIELAMSLSEGMSSRTSLNRRITCPAHGHYGPAAARIVDFDAAGNVVAIGEQEVATWPGAPRGEPMRDARAAVPVPAAGIEVTISAETKSQIQVGANEPVDFRIELSSEAMPLAVSKAVQANNNQPIVVSLTAENDAVQILRDREYTVDPPVPRQPQRGFFLVRGSRVGVSRLAVAFRQGGTELGIIGLAVEVVEAAASSERAQGNATAAPRDFADDDTLLLIVEQRVEGGELFYQYILHSEALGLPYSKLRSKPLLDRGGGPAATVLAFVERVYERVTQELKSFDDLKQLQIEARALGVSLCRELLDPAVASQLWRLRDRIKLIQIVSWEPYIPWELVRLRDPESGDIDDRFLAEYGLVRTLADEIQPRELLMAEWGYLAAVFPMGTLPPVGAELDYFTGTTAESLCGHGIKPRLIPATRDDFYEALAELDYDVLHVSCHASSPHQSIERASLIIGDETPPGGSKPRLVEVDIITVEAEARLRRRRPLVFLNACETGRVGAMLTAWGGWPNVFVRAGAGAFVGAAWAVRDKPAAAFSTAFYNALLDGKTLAEAAGAARASAKKLGDASWLAFRVYGHPRARRAPTIGASDASR